jgi:SAM-dependent methyltransferase
MATEPDHAARWDDAYAHGDAIRSWFQAAPRMSMRMLGAVGVVVTDSLIDVGGGASPLAATLLERGFRDVTVLDISAVALRQARQRLGPDAGRVHWLIADIRTWRPPRCFQAWHDRAVFHFLTAAPDQQQYLRTMGAATGANAVAVFGCFAPDGPQQCSGLPVARYGPQELADALGPGWALIADDRELHTTPAGLTQPFTWVALRKIPEIPP